MVKKTFFKTLIAVSFSAALESALFFSACGSSLWTTTAHANSVFTSFMQQPGFADIVSQVKPAVVSVQVKSNKKKTTGPLAIFLAVRVSTNYQINIR